MSEPADTSPQDTPEGGAEPLACSPCRGIGKLTSGFGGTPHEVVCAWCEGSGVTIPEHDAQEAGVRLRAAAG